MHLFVCLAPALILWWKIPKILMLLPYVAVEINTSDTGTNS